jgi:hypothetical protein
MNNTVCCKMYLHCNAEFIEYASTSFGRTNTFGCVQIILLSSCSDMLHLNYRTVSPTPIVTLWDDRTLCSCSIKYRCVFFEGYVQYLESWSVENLALMLLVGCGVHLCCGLHICELSTHWNIGEWKLSAWWNTPCLSCFTTPKTPTHYY